MLQSGVTRGEQNVDGRGFAAGEHLVEGAIGVGHAVRGREGFAAGRFYRRRR